MTSATTSTGEVSTAMQTAMVEVPVELGDRRYPVLIGPGLLASAGDLIALGRLGHAFVAAEGRKSSARHLLNLLYRFVRRRIQEISHRHGWRCRAGGVWFNRWGLSSRLQRNEQQGCQHNFLREHGQIKSHGHECTGGV